METLNENLLVLVASGKENRVEKGNFYCVSLYTFAFLKTREFYKADRLEGEVFDNHISGSFPTLRNNLGGDVACSGSGSSVVGQERGLYAQSRPLPHNDHQTKRGTD